MNINEDPKQKFSKVKANLKPGEFEYLTDFNRIKQRVLQNRNKVMESEVAKRREGIFQFKNFEKFFSIDGSIISKEEPDDLFYINFFKKYGRLATKGDTYYLRGERYLAAINPNLEAKQRLDILFEDFVDGINILFNETKEVSTNEFIFKQELAVLDYVKNSSVTILNALIQYEKKGIFRLDDKEYTDIRKLAVLIAQRCVKIYFSYLIGDFQNFRIVIENLKKQLSSFEYVIRYMEQEYREGVLKNESFSRPEANHPLIIGAHSLLNSEKKDLHPDIIIGFPAGGTELTLAQQYAFEISKHYQPQIVLMPLSLYSVMQMPKIPMNENPTITPITFLEQYRKSIDGKEVMIVEDNSNTGNTIQRFYDLITENFKPQKVTVFVAEADIIRSKQLKNSKIRTTIASDEVYNSVVNILPVSKKGLKTEMKEDIERQRLIKEAKINLEHASDATERIMYSIFLMNLGEPTTGFLNKLNEENSIKQFSGTFLSNMYTVPITYYGVKYTSVEKAYQAEKFKSVDLERIPSEIMDEIQESFRKRGFYWERNDLAGFFIHPYVTSINAKNTANILRKHGFQKPEWEDIKIKIMLELLQLKFKDPKMMQLLKETGNKYLVEGNDWGDTFWGIDNKIGKNLLGLALMYIRDTSN